MSFAAAAKTAYGIDEITIAGGLMGVGVETVAGKTVDLQVPAHAELSIEGWVSPTDREAEGPFGEALGYIRHQWKPLQTYLSDGRVPLDNNEVEQLMKQVALGRKNWLFIGSVPAGQRAADFITLVSSAWRNDLDVWAYIKDVLDRLLAGETDYAALRPDSWRQTHPEASREYRVTERRDRADRKQYRRAARRRNTPKPTH